MHKKIISVMFIAAFLFTFFGSTKAGTLDDLNLVTFIIMHGKDEEGLYHIDFVFSTGSLPSGEVSAGYSVITGAGKTFAECVNNAENMTAKTVFFGHMKSVFFDESFFSQRDNFAMFAQYADHNSYFNYYLTMYVLSDSGGSLKKAMEDDEKSAVDFINNMVKKFPL